MLNDAKLLCLLSFYFEYCLSALEKSKKKLNNFLKQKSKMKNDILTMTRMDKDNSILILIK